MNKKWYSIVDTKADVGEVSIFDEVGAWGVTASQFLEDFKAIRDKSEIYVYINSPGGDVMDGMAIYNLLASVRPKVKIEVFGMAASIASVIALAGSELVMDEGTYYVIHNPWSFSIGDSDQLRKDADTLDKIKEEILNIYEAHSDVSREELEKMLDEETWFTASEAVEKGFATSVNKQAKAAASLYNLSGKGFNKVPKNLTRPTVSLNTMNAREFEQFLRDVGLSRQDAVTVASMTGLGMKQKSESTATDEIEVLEAMRNIFN